MAAAFEQQNIMVDELIQNMYNYNVYGRYKDTTASVDSSATLSDALNDTKETQKSLLQLMKVYGEDISNTYQHTANMYDDQTNMTNLVSEHHDMMKKRNEDILDLNHSNQRKHELYSYYYYKYRVQLKVLYSFLSLVIFLIVITLLNRYFELFLNNTMYIVLSGLSCAIFLIILGRNIYDLFLRSDMMFHEYDAKWSPPNEIQQSLHFDREAQKIQDLKEKCEREKTNI